MNKTSSMQGKKTKNLIQNYLRKDYEKRVIPTKPTTKDEKAFTKIAPPLSKHSESKDELKSISQKPQSRQNASRATQQRDKISSANNKDSMPVISSPISRNTIPEITELGD